MMHSILDRLLAYRVTCPPSISKQLNDILFRHDIQCVGEFCRLSEEQIAEITELTPYMLEKINMFLAEHGLHTGMSEDEISEYMDSDFFKEHPEEAVSLNKTVIPPVEEMEEASASEDDQYIDNLVRAFLSQQVKGDEKKAPALTSKIMDCLLCKEKEDFGKSFDDELKNRSDLKLYSTDIEFIRLHLFRTFYADQPWYVRYFKTLDDRIELAKVQTEAVLSAYTEELKSLFVKERLQKYAREIKENWDEHYQSYLAKLEDRLFHSTKS